MRLSDLPNISNVLEKQLKSIGINTYEDLAFEGSVKVAQRLMVNNKVCINKLYALEGAIRDIRWHNLTTEEKIFLKKQFYD